MWLLAYESDLKGWLAEIPANFVENDEFFKHLRAKKISFYDEHKNVLHINKKKPRKRSAAFMEFIGKWGTPDDWEIHDFSLVRRD